MLINIGAAYIRAEDIRMIAEKEVGTEEDKNFGITVYTTSGNFNHMCEGRTERDELISRIREEMNSPGEELIEIRKQMANINGRLNQMDRKLGEIRKMLKEGKNEKQDT